MSENMIVKQVYIEIQKLHVNGFHTWISKVCELARHYNIEFGITPNEFKSQCKSKVYDEFKNI